MLTVDRCRKLLEASDLSNEAIEEIRDALYSLARLAVEEVRRANVQFHIDEIETLEERAAICEFDGGLNRDRAEELAVIQFDAWKEKGRR